MYTKSLTTPAAIEAARNALGSPENNGLPNGNSVCLPVLIIIVS
jgi:hypothetical protein